MFQLLSSEVNFKIMNNYRDLYILDSEENCMGKTIVKMSL